MSGEDVYDLAVWCHICDKAHSPCEEPWLDDLDYECLTCHHGEATHDDGGQCTAHGCTCRDLLTGVDDD